jgi:hypothetical protein
MIDSSRSPRPLWKRTLTVIALTVFITVLAWQIWVKELHHKNIHVHASGVNIATVACAAGYDPVA